MNNKTMTQEDKIKEIIRLSNTNQVYGVADFDDLHESLHEDLAGMAKWKEQQMIEKVCDWLESNLCYYDENYRGIDSGNSLIEDFKQAMEE